jgi:Rrf2 family nitric oxide-sensitive transcriptional repressor
MKVVSNLTRLQFVSAQRGPGGGIQLNRAPEEICLKEVIRNTEKHLHKVNGKSLAEQHGATADSRLKGYLHHALQAYLDTLGSFTLADVLNPGIDAAEVFDLSEEAA